MMEAVSVCRGEGPVPVDIVSETAVLDPALLSIRILSPHYPRKKKDPCFHKYEESHTPKGIKDP